MRFLFRPARYKVLHGGRGGGKSWGIAQALLLLAMRRKLLILCTREIQSSINDSVLKLLRNQIERLGVGDRFVVTKNSIRCTNGSEFIFSGLRTNVEKRIKSTEGVDIAWCEEAETVSDLSWSVLIPTIRKEGSEIWVSFNPNLETDPTHRRFLKNPPPDAIVKEIGWEDNKHLPETLRKEKDHLYSVDPDAAEHVWGGKTRSLSKAQVLYGKVVVESFEPSEDWDGPYQGADWGFAVDPTALVRLWVTEEPGAVPPERTLWVEREAYGVGVDITDTPALFDSVPGARDYVTRADSARPETISHMQQNGYPLMEAAAKGPGSVEDGVAHLRGYKRIVIHQRCTHAADEARLWSYKKNRAGDILPILVDKHNHIWDSARYALEPIIKQQKPTGTFRLPEAPANERPWPS